MSILFLSCVCDSIKKYCNTCGSFTEIHEAGTSSADASIVSTICCSIVHLASIFVLGFLVWKIIDHIAKGIAGLTKRSWDVSDRVKKQEADLLNKRLEFRKEMCYVIKNIPQEKSKDDKAKGTKTLKELKKSDSDEVKAYLDALGEKENVVTGVSQTDTP